MARSLRAAKSPSQAKLSKAPATPSVPKPRSPQTSLLGQPSLSTPAAASKRIVYSSIIEASWTPDWVRSESRVPAPSFRSVFQVSSAKAPLPEPGSTSMPRKVPLPSPEPK